MKKIVSKSLMGIAALVAFAGLTTPAKADDGYCREYTRTVNIGGRMQDAYGNACLQPDGSWMIVGEGLGNDIPDNVTDVQYVIHDNTRVIVPQRVVYYNRAPVRPVAPVFVWYQNGFYRHGHYTPYRQTYNWNRYDHNYHNSNWDHRGHH